MACDDGFVWRHIFQKHFPSSSLIAANSADWKHAFNLERNGVLGSLVCFHTKQPFTEEVLGLPIMFTTNPKTGVVDAAMPSFYPLSVAAFYDQKVRFSADLEKIDTVIPLYITAEHFAKGLPYIEKAIVRICPHLGTRFIPEMILHALPVILSTVVVLLSDKGVCASEKAIDVYCALHRLFLALVEQYNLLKCVEARVVAFCRQSTLRAKSKCPNLGIFASLISVCASDATSWLRVLPAVMTESMNRSILWLCKADPSLQASLGAVDDPNADFPLLEEAFKASSVSLRLWMIHAAFINLIARPKGVDPRQVKYDYDSLYGRPSTGLKQIFRQRIECVLGAKTWPQFFEYCGLEQVSPAQFTRVLRQSWKNSLQLGYHTEGMDFSRIQRSGVSKLLTKGESHDLLANNIHLYLGSGNSSILCGACLLYSADGKCLDTVHYSRRYSANRAIRHSGDSSDACGHSCHTIDCALHKLPSNVYKIYFTLCSCGDGAASLSHFAAPRINLTDKGTGSELCEYQLQGDKKGKAMSVVMASMTRSIGGKGWQVTAIGGAEAETEQRCCGNYKCVQDVIAKLARK
jgi:stress response protein SCP2